MDGNHGGATRDETEAALFLYAKTTLRRPTSTDSKAVPRVEQIDLVPTLATLLGLPVPFGNLGSLLPGINYGRDTETLGATLAVTSQIARYLVAYNLQSPTLSEDSLQRLQERLAALTAQATECMEQRCSSALSLAQDLHVSTTTPGLTTLCSNNTSQPRLHFLSYFFFPLCAHGVLPRCTGI